ncbi:MAG TPA: basic secretory protein-like protein, partial [Ktedonobacteraceae bacterium]|nr:basic secretory protein-like protein [Ktedonobacteraceae bacterium]
VLIQLARWGKLLGVASSQVEDIESSAAWSQALRAAIGTRQMLLVIDDAWTVEDAQALRIGGPACTHLLTTRQSQVALGIDQQEAILVPPLEEADGLALLARFIPEVVERDPQGARALVRATEGLPLALTLIGKYLASHSQTFTQQPEPLQAVLRLLHNTEQHLGESTLTGPGQHSLGLPQTMPLYLHATIAICDQQLESQAHTALCALAFFPSKPQSFSEEAALAASQQPEETLDMLRDVGLLETCGPGRYTLHQAVANYARAQSEGPIAQQQLVSSLVRESQPEQNTRSTRHPLFIPSVWDDSLDHIKRVSTFGPSSRFSRHPLLIRATILLAILLIAGVLPAFTGLSSLLKKQVSPSPSNTHVKDTYGPPLYTLRFLNTDPSLEVSVQNLQNVFNAVYAQLVNRFALDPASVANNTVTIAFSSDLDAPARTSGTTITINAHWIEQHSTEMGLLTHQLTLIIEHYPSRAPAWFSDGMADYARSVYGPADDNWSLPNSVRPQDSYTQGGAVAARFLLWLEQHTKLDSVDQLNYALQTRQSFSAAFYRLTHHTVDDLWNQYKKQPDITLTPQQLYKAATSRKPLYQSSFRLKWSDPQCFAYAQDLYLSNLTMQADITMVSGSSDAGAGFFFRSSTSNIHWYGLYLFANGDYRLDYEDTPGTLHFSSAIKEGLNQTNRLTIIVQKHTIYLYVNSQFIMQADDNRLSYGLVGVIRTKYSSPPDIRFDKVQVF